MDMATWLTEAFVGLVCLGLAFATSGRSGAVRWIGVAIGVAGVVAVVHAIVLLF
jgi:hypothetical protein